ncbi:PTS sugar transporter [Priestia endophytica]|uniref:PTS sugar transporter n=1 Tax=Priestia endophytica TaxID=135735 RepID=UPI000F53EEB7|nr:PTS sugar transporter [Priestia endophytica]RPK09384.1 hypothetical protein FH5_04247 [Priestia endophytica]
MKKIFVMASSGGNLYHLGGSSPDQLMKELNTQVKEAGFVIEGAQFIATDASMDALKKNTKARLLEWNQEKEQLTLVLEDRLEAVNEKAKEVDQKVAKSIYAGNIDGIIAMSADPKGANKLAAKATAEKKIPLVGTGGTSMAAFGSLGAHIISQSGTTGTSNKTRAIGFVTSLSKHWGVKYRPVLNEKQNKNDLSSRSKKVNFRSIMTSSLPAFISLAIILALSKIPGLEKVEDIFDLLIAALPVVIAVIAARQIADLDEISIVAGVVAGVVATDSGILGGLLAGICAGYLVPALFSLCTKWRFPTTTVNIVAGGLGGLLPGLAVYFILGPIALKAGNLIRNTIESMIDFNPIIAGTLAGLLIWPAILAGIYHAAILPIVILEMEKTGNSFLGSVDMVGLVMVAAGINLANIIFPKKRGESAAAAPSFLINMGFGTFVESAYPFMFASKLVFIGALLSSGIGGMIVGLYDLRGTAYVPSVIAPFLSNHTSGFIIAMLASLLASFIFTASANKLETTKSNKKASAFF